MQLNRNTSMSKTRNLVKLSIKIVLILSTMFIAIILLNKIDFPSPYMEIKKIIGVETSACMLRRAERLLTVWRSNIFTRLIIADLFKLEHTIHYKIVRRYIITKNSNYMVFLIIQLQVSETLVVWPRLTLNCSMTPRKSLRTSWKASLLLVRLRSSPATCFVRWTPTRLSLIS